MSKFTPPDLAYLLAEGVDGAPANIEAAVGLLVAHRDWLDHPLFRKRCVITAEDLGIPATFAAVDWPEAVLVVCEADADGTATRVVLIAAELAGHDSTIPLDGLLGGIDPGTAELVVTALTHAITTPDSDGDQGEGVDQ